MAKNYQQLWEGARRTPDWGQAVWNLTEISADKQGRAFLLNLEPEDAELCIEILHHVCHHS